MDHRRTATTVEAAVSVRGVGKDFSGAAAVDDVSFELGEGRFLTILGPSGSGKTTLLRMIAGFEEPSRGEIAIRGRLVQDVPPYRRSIGMVFQRLALFPHMTVEENVAFPLKMRRFDARSIAERVERYLIVVRLGGLGHRRVNELSGGQQQRVAIARALVFEPDLLLLDEPLASLDRKLREEMQIEFRRIQRELGVTTINVTHDQREALVMSDEIIVMDKGRIQQKARPAETYYQPANPFVAGFIGVTNFLAGTVRASDAAGVRFAVGSVELEGLAAPQGASFTAGARVRAAIRAEQVRIQPDSARPDGLAMVLKGAVEDVIFEGERVVYEVRIKELNALVRVLSHDPAVVGEIERGSPVFLGWNARDLLVFEE